MNSVTVKNMCDIPADSGRAVSWNNNARLFALKVLKEIKHNNWEFTLLFCDDKKIAELNNQYRNKNEPTDILTFKIDESKGFFPARDNNASFYNPGDIVISLDTLKENASFYNVPLDEELRRLIIHGILHLDGMNHKTNNKNEPMLEFQETILGRLGNEKIIIDAALSATLSAASSAASRGTSSAASSAASRGTSSAASSAAPRGGKK
ncbi:MAG: rRNA maturation RNase YbeY [Treponema sp.]|nr:rRNA maturation RNase YbeY [Treponema sp.]